MVLSDWAECPCCKFPATATQFIRIISAEGRCPMCNEVVELGQVSGMGGWWLREQEEARRRM